MRLELRPEGHEHLDTLAEQDDVEQRDADVARAQLPAQRDDQRGRQHRDAHDDQVQHQRQPALHREEQVERPLRAVLLLQRALESKRPHRHEAC